MAIRIGESGSVTLKALMVGAIVLLLLIPLAMVRGLVSERSQLREQAYARVAEGWGGNIVLGGPMLVVPTERTVIVGKAAKIMRADVYVLPSRLNADVDLTMQDEPRYVGIYAVPVYLAKVRLQGEFDFAALKASAGSEVRYLWAQSRLLLPLSQVRSLRQVAHASFAGGSVKLGPARPGIHRGVEARVDLSELVQGASAAFDVRTVVAGSRDFSMLPLGSDTSVRLHSNWPHPSFQGAFLPIERQIAATGFDARWQVLELNRAYGQIWTQDQVAETALAESAFGVGLYQAVDVYQRSERAVKYALLFIALTFLTFFMWEQISRLRLHPLQYLLVGLALSTFYLLLIALSEHLAFALAYAIAAVALVALIGVYVAGALRRSTRGIVAGAAMTGVYGLLYVLVLSEDYALLLGAIVLFSSLAAVMLVTRKIDWYRLSPEPGPRAAADQA